MQKMKWLPWLGWGMGTILLVLANIIFFNAINERIRAQNYQIFLDLVTEAETDIENKLLFYEEILWGGVGLFHASNSVERNEWVAYVEALELQRYPGINGVGYIERILSKDLDEFINKAKEEYPQYNRSIVGDIKADDHLMILYIEPEEKNRAAVGLDIGSETNRRTAAFRARDSGQAILTEPISLVQNQNQAPGFLMLLPVYQQHMDNPTLVERRQSFVGWIYAAFIAENFLETTLHSPDYLGFSVASTGANPSLIYSHDDSVKEVDAFRAKSQIDLGGTTWELEWWSKSGLEERLSSFGLSRLTLILGLLLTLGVALVSGVLLFRVTQGQRREKLLQSSITESETKFTEAFDNAAIGIALVSLEGRWLQVNDSLCQMLGYTSAELMKKTFQEITHPDDLEKDLIYVQKVLDGKIRTYTMEKRYFHKKGQTVWIRLNVSLVRDGKGNPKFFVSEIENITRTKLLDSIKSDFVSITSHQFRTPLSGIRWNLESLMDGGLRKYAPKKIKIILNDILESVLRMNELVKDLLRVSKIESGLVKAKLKVVDIKKVLRREIKELKLFAELKNQKIILRRNSESVLARADEGFVAEVFKILVHNALIYAPENSEITLEFEMRAKYFYLHVENDGVPIPPKEQKRLYEKFSRLQHGVQRNPNGSGLGLFIAHNLLELMNADVKYDTKNTERIRFTVKFQRAKG